MYKSGRIFVEILNTGRGGNTNKLAPKKLRIAIGNVYYVQRKD